jgi:Flp pilus assembly protein TadD
MANSLFTLILLVVVLAVSSCNRGAGSGTAVSNTEAPQPSPLAAFADANQAFEAGSKLLDENKTEQAIDALTQATTLNPDFAEAYFKLGIAYSLLESQRKLNAEAEQPSEEPANNKKTKEIRTDSEKAFEKAVAAYKKIIDKNPEDDAAFFNLGRAYNKLNEDEDAEKALKQAVKLKPDDSQYQTELGSILIKLAQYSEAVAALRKAVDLDADNLEAQDLLDKAEAGKKRIDFATVKKDDKKPSKEGNSADANLSNSAAAASPTPPDTRKTPPPPPANKPQ